MDLKQLSRISDSFISDESDRSKAYREAIKQMPDNFYAKLVSYLTTNLPTKEADKKAGKTVETTFKGNIINVRYLPEKTATPSQKERYGYSSKYIEAIVHVNGVLIKDVENSKFVTPSLVKKIVQAVCTMEINGEVSIKRTSNRDITNDYRELSSSKLSKLGITFPKGLQSLMKRSSTGKRQNQVKQGSGVNSSYLSEEEYNFLKNKNPEKAEKFEKKGSIYLNKSKRPQIYNIKSDIRVSTLTQRTLAKLKEEDEDLKKFCNEFNKDNRYLLFKNNTYVLLSSNELKRLR